MKQEEKERSGRIVIRISALLLALTVLGEVKSQSMPPANIAA